MTDVAEHRKRIEDAVRAHVLPLVAEAKRDGYAADVYASLDMSGQAQVRASVVLR